LQRSIGNRRTARILEPDHSRGKNAAAPRLQRKMGFEAEVRRPIFDATGAKFPGDAPLLDHPFFTVVSDSQTGTTPGTTDKVAYSNIEIVLKPFDQLQGSRDDALAALQTRLAAVQAMLGLIYPAAPHADAWTLGSVLTTATTAPPGGAAPLPGLALPTDEHGNPIDTRLAEIAPKRVTHDDDGKLFVHYSIGIPPELLADALAMVTTKSRRKSVDPIVTQEFGPRRRRRRRKVINQEANFAKEHAAAAPRVANRIAATFATALTADEKREFVGQLVLVFTHMAAFANIVAAQAGQPKNYILALSRAPLRSVYDTLSPATQAALHTNAAAIYDELGTGLETSAVRTELAEGRLPKGQILSDFNDDDERQVKDTSPTIKLSDYVASGLGRHAAIDQEDVFGGMNEVAPDVSVFGGQTARGRGVVLELRSLGAQRVDFATMTLALENLLTWSRTAILGHD
jgi:hypothetical protein